jgi:hypothetical protein
VYRTLKAPPQATERALAAEVAEAARAALGEAAFAAAWAVGAALPLAQAVHEALSDPAGARADQTEN